MPVKNEVDILPITLNIISQYSDIIIIADQMSDDGSRELYKKFPKVKVIDNLRQGHSNEVRWDLLAAAREYEGNNLIISLDADEYIPPEIFGKFLNSYNFKVGDSFRFSWVQLWRSVDFYNNRGVWFRNFQRIAWVDDRKTKYDSNVVINDHTSRIPAGFLQNCKRVDGVPIIHLQWVSWEKVQWKQAWYRCVELIKNPNSYLSINRSYSHSLPNNQKLSKVPNEWIMKRNDLKLVENFLPTWHRKAIYNLFDKHGIVFFEPLQIWHISELYEEFVKRTGKPPQSREENKVIKFARDIKQSLVKLIHY